MQTCLDASIPGCKTGEFGRNNRRSEYDVAWRLLGAFVAPRDMRVPDMLSSPAVPCVVIDVATSRHHTI